MKENELFELALNIHSPWLVQEISFDGEKKRLDIEIDFESGSMLPCPECKSASKVYDTVQKEWRHLNFFQHETYLHARVPRVSCNEHGVRLVDVPGLANRVDLPFCLKRWPLQWPDRCP
jgi:transposase